MGIYFFDTQVMIWAVKGEAEPDQAAMIPRAQYLVEKLQAENGRLVVPAVVVAELQMRVRPQNQTALTALIEQAFIIAPFGTREALLFGRMWQANKAQHHQSNATREKLKLDYLIAATAVASDATCIYTHDKDLQSFTAGFIDCRMIPEIPQSWKQSSLDV